MHIVGWAVVCWIIRGHESGANKTILPKYRPFDRSLSEPDRVFVSFLSTNIQLALAWRYFLSLSFRWVSEGNSSGALTERFLQPWWVVGVRPRQPGTCAAGGVLLWRGKRNNWPGERIWYYTSEIMIGRSFSAIIHNSQVIIEDGPRCQFPRSFPFCFFQVQRSCLSQLPANG